MAPTGLDFPWVLHPGISRCLPVCQLGSRQGMGGGAANPHFIFSQCPFCVILLFFSPSFLPPSSQKGWFSSESLKHICIPKTSLGINSSQCRGLFFFFPLPILLLFLPSFLSKPEMNSVRTLAIPAPSHCATWDYKGSEGFPFLPIPGVRCCCSVLLLTILRDNTLIAPLATLTFFSSPARPSFQKSHLSSIPPAGKSWRKGEPPPPKKTKKQLDSKMLICGDKLKSLGRPRTELQVTDVFSDNLYSYLSASRAVIRISKVS